MIWIIYFLGVDMEFVFIFVSYPGVEFICILFVFSRRGHGVNLYFVCIFPGVDLELICIVFVFFQARTWS